MSTIARLRAPWLALVVLSALAACSAPVHRQLVRVGPPESSLLFRDVAVFPATGPALVPHQDVLVRAGRIAEVRPTGGEVPAGARVVDGQGRTLLPGFVDSHVHIGSNGAAPWQDVPTEPAANLAGWLYAGVTTVFDLGGFANDTAKWRAKVESGEWPGPRIFLTHIPITAPDSHPLPAVRAMAPWPLSALAGAFVHQVTSPAQAPAVIADVVERGVDYVKITCDQIPPGSPELDAASLTALVQATHAKGLKAVVHVGSADNALAAARAGADVLAHMVWRSPLTAEQAATLAASGVHVILTLTGWRGVVAMAEGKYQATALDREISPAALLDGVSGAAGRQFGEVEVLGEMAHAAHEASPHWQANIQALVAAGVPLLVGTDSPLPGAYVGGSLHEEMRLMVEAGVPAAEVLLGATSRPARLIAPQAGFGTVEPGQIADLVLVQGDPLADITATQRIELVVSRGRVVERLRP